MAKGNSVFGPNYEDMIDECGEYKDDGNRATFPHSNDGGAKIKEDKNDTGTDKY